MEQQAKEAGLTKAEHTTLVRLAGGDTIAYSQDGDNGWFRSGDRAFVGNEVISLRAQGFIARKMNKDDETDNYRGLAEYDEITDAGRAALAKVQSP